MPDTSLATSVQRGLWLRWTLVGLLAGAVLLAASSIALMAQEEEPPPLANREYPIKAAYLYQFGRYIEWPARTFPNAKAPFVIGVLEGDPTLPDLDRIAQSKTIQNRPIEIRRFPTPRAMQACHILFLPGSVPPESQSEVVRRLTGRGGLLVGESDDFLDLGGTIRFTVENNKVRIQVARKAAQREGLIISAKLLQVAHVVD